MITRIDEDTIKITIETFVKISDLEAKNVELEAIDASAKEHNAWVASLPKDKLVNTMPETEQEVQELQSKIDEYKALSIVKPVVEIIK